MRRALDWAGRTLLVTGVLTLLFVAYQFWGTNLVQGWEQRSLARGLDDRLAAAAPAPSPAPEEAPEEAPERARTGPTTTSTTTTSTTLPPPVLGEPIGRLEIAAIGLDQVIVEGVGRDELRKGPGHYPHSPLPGRSGNAALAGHRTTYGAPFNELDELAEGDEIRVTMPEGVFVYLVESTRIVTPDDVSVVLDQGDDRLTLTTCHPEYSARQRLIVSARLDGDPVDVPEPAAPPAEPPELPGEPVELPGEPVEAELARGGDGALQLDGAEGGLDGLSASTAGWTAALLAVGGAWWWAFRRRPRWWVWGGGVLPFLFVLFFFFGQIERLLPGNY